MPSDFISLLSADFDLNSPKSLYSKESVYDLLPKELQLPSSTESNTTAMSQKSGGEAGPPPPAALASDATSTSSSMSMGGPRSAFPASSSPTMHPSTSVTDRASVHNSCSLGEGVSSQGAAELVVDGRLPGAGSGGGNGSSSGGGGGGCRANSNGGEASAVGGGAGAPQTTPSKRRTVLNISPPPEDLLDDSRMSCQGDPPQDSEQSNSIWMDDSASNFSLVSSSSYNDNSEVPRKSRKRTPRQRPGPKPASAEGASMDVFNADSAKGPHFVLSQLGPDSKACPKGSSAERLETAGQKGGALSGQHPVRAEGKELKIVVQPETQHRARYLTEGSRGSVKDRTQQGFPTIKLEGVSEPVVLQVFVGNDAGRVKPHGFYQACRVSGRNTTACKEVDIEGTTVIEVCLEPSNSMTLAVDCVGILKLRNTDVEARIGIAGSKKKSTRARLVFRVNIPRPDGSTLTLQTPSSSILCTQPAGVPEILKKSLHSCTAKGGEELFLIGKNFLKGTKVVFQENASDEKSWKAEAEIDMELFHQNHLIVKVPPYQNLAISSPVSVGIYVMTNAGRSHDMQSFTYTPKPVKTVDVSVKKEAPPLAKPCSFEEQINVMQNSSCLDSALMGMMPMVKREEITPMEVSSNSSTGAIFKVNESKTSDIIGSAQQTLDMNSSAPPNASPYPSPMSLQPGDQEQQQGAAYAGAEPRSTIQKQDLAGGSFSMSGDGLLQQVPHQFLLEAGESRARDRVGPGAGLPQMGEAPQQPLFPQDSVAQLERAVRQLQAGGFSGAGGSVQQVLEAAVAQQRFSSVLYGSAPVADAACQPAQELQSAESAQQQQVLGSLQQQLQTELFQPPIPMQCGLFQGGARGEAPEQHAPPQAMVQNRASLFQPPDNMLRGTPVQQQPALFQQAGELLSIQTSSFLQQAPSHPSPPQQLFHAPGSLAEAADPQGALFQGVSMTALTGSAISTDQQQQPAASGRFLPGQLASDAGQQKRAQMAFLAPMQTVPAEPQPVFQAPMEQPAPTQPQGSLFQNLSPHTPVSALPPPQPQPTGLLYCSNGLGPREQSCGLLFSPQGQVTPMSSSGLPPQEPRGAPLLFSQAGAVEASEPMSFQDQSSEVGAQRPSEPPRPGLFQDQQPMQVAPSSRPASEQPITIFMPQPAMVALQGGMGPQELPQTAIFAAPNGVAGLQTTSSSPVQQQQQQQPGSLFQTAVSGTLSQPGQAQQSGLFLFGIQSECGQLINGPGPTLSDQLIAISQSCQSQRQSDAQMQSLLSRTLSDAGSVPGGLSVSQNMEKIDDLLVSLQEGGTLSRSY